MKITEIRLSRHQLAFEPAFQPSWDTRRRDSFIVDLVRVETDEGLTGIGSGDCMAGFSGHEELFIGEDPRSLERHFRVIENLSFHYGRMYPLDCALWDLYGKITGEPVWRLLGGASGRVRTYASTGSLREADALADQAERMAGEGFPAMKIRFQRPDWRDDITALEQARASVGEAFHIMVDCNQGWRMPWDRGAPWTFKHALTIARYLEELDVYWMEEPLHRGDYDGMIALRQASDLRIAGGELTREMHELRDLVSRGCLDVLQSDCVVTGGITGLSRIAQLCRLEGVEFTPHTWGNGIGLLANAHLAAAAGSKYLEYPYDPPNWLPGVRDFPLVVPVSVDDEGWLDLGEAPGLGIELDEARLKASEV